jgi:hypothetical protein
VRIHFEMGAGVAGTLVAGALVPDALAAGAFVAEAAFGTFASAVICTGASNNGASARRLIKYATNARASRLGTISNAPFFTPVNLAVISGGKASSDGGRFGDGVRSSNKYL